MGLNNCTTRSKCTKSLTLKDKKFVIKALLFCPNSASYKYNRKSYKVSYSNITTFSHNKKEKKIKCIKQADSINTHK